LNGASSVVNVDGTETTGSSGSSPVWSAGTNTMAFGSDFSGGERLVGTLAEGIVYYTNVSSGDRTSLCHNAYTYWGTPTSC
jgi:hypothetical protein